VVQTVTGDDELYGHCLWQAAETYDKAGNTNKSIATWLKFVMEREGENVWPSALFNLAQAYQAAAQYGEAIKHYETLLRKHPKSLATFDAIVPLARCYLQQEPPAREKAENILRAVLNDPTATPRASRFRDAMFELGQLYYQNEQYDKSITILTEAIERYQNDRQLGKYMFLVADSFRKSGLALDKIISEYSEDPTATVNLKKTYEQRMSYLNSACEYFSRSIDLYNKQTKRNELDELYLRHCYLYRADCYFDLGRYREASELYEMAALRYQLTPTALSALAQIVNCHLKTGNYSDARSTNQRAILQLRKIPEEAFDEKYSLLTRKDWEEWFDWTDSTNLW
jgi:tetratricopeptide (TPR) repeat protein